MAVLQAHHVQKTPSGQIEASMGKLTNFLKYHTTTARSIQERKGQINNCSSLQHKIEYRVKSWEEKKSVWSLWWLDWECLRCVGAVMVREPTWCAGISTTHPQLSSLYLWSPTDLFSFPLKSFLSLNPYPFLSLPLNPLPLSLFPFPSSPSFNSPLFPPYVSENGVIKII